MDESKTKGGIQFFGRGDGFGRKNDNKGRERNDDRRGPRQMYDAICSNCGKKCQIPFQPTSDKPVYCDDCFAKLKGNRGRNDRGYGRDRRGGFGDRRPRNGGEQRDQYKGQFENLNAKLDKILRMLQPKEVEVKRAEAQPVEVLPQEPVSEREVLVEKAPETEVQEAPKAKKVTRKRVTKKKEE